jgi:SAM-dependent methyltransferase
MSAMEDYEASTYGDRIADLYDDMYGDFDPGPAVAVLADLAQGGPVLELGIGTGRLALPLAACGVPVDGIDASAGMVDRLRAKPGGAGLDITIADFADFQLDRSYQLIYVAFNTFFGLADDAQQQSCFAAVARHLSKGGRFVIEAFVPDLNRFDRNQRVGVSSMAGDRVVLDASQHDPVAQRVVSQHIVITESGIRLMPVVVRYAYPPELDLMAERAGLACVERWNDWDRSPFDAASGKHISVYQLSR